MLRRTKEAIIQLGHSLERRERRQRARKQARQVIEVDSAEALSMMTSWNSASLIEVHFDEVVAGGKPELQLVGYTDFAGGFSKVTRQVIKVLRDDFSIRLRRLPSTKDIDPFEYYELEKLEKVELKSPERATMLAIGGPQMFAGRMVRRARCHPKVAYTMYETRFIPKKMVDWVQNGTDHIILPSRPEYRKWVASGAQLHRISVVPLGVDLELYRPDVEPLRTANLRSFVFGVVAGFSARKGMKELLWSYCNAFDAQDDVTLFLVCKSSLKPYGWSHRFDRRWWSMGKTIARYIQEGIDTGTVARQWRSMPHIVLFEVPVQEFLMPHIYRAMSVLGMPSRGECFWLPGLEAAAMGIPVWNLDVGGHREYMTADNSTLVRHRGWERADAEMEAVSCLYRGQEFPVVDLDDCVDKMRWLHDHHDKALVKAERLRAEIQTGYSWQAVGERLKETLLSLD